jgi:type IV secretion system protein VirB9
MIKSIPSALLAACLAAGALCGASPSHAQAIADPIPIPSDSRIVTFTYSPDAIYTVLTAPGTVTHIELATDEGVVEKPALGDTVQWRVSGGPRNLYVKPVRPDVYTTMVLVTNRHTYQFDLRASPVGGKRYQKITFQYPDDEAQVRLAAETAARDAARAVEAEKHRLDSQKLLPEVDPVSMNFGYSMEGIASFRPSVAFDNGKFTYLRMPTTQDMPAVFAVDGEGKNTLVNYLQKGSFIEIQRVSPVWRLKLGKEEVTITSDAAKKPRWTPFSRRDDQ